jgi:hypothetical protein
VGQLFEYTNKVPMAITGWERNPLAGPIGILTMGGLAIAMGYAAKLQMQKRSRLVS